jgi:hypothetical protein
VRHLRGVATRTSSPIQSRMPRVFSKMLQSSAKATVLLPGRTRLWKNHQLMWREATNKPCLDQRLRLMHKMSESIRKDSRLRDHKHPREEKIRSLCQISLIRTPWKMSMKPFIWLLENQMVNRRNNDLCLQFLKIDCKTLVSSLAIESRAPSARRSSTASLTCNSTTMVIPPTQPRK